MKLEGKTAVITGAGRGLGKSIARTFAEEGADLTLAARSDEVFASAKDIDPQALVMRGDVADPHFVRGLIGRTYERYGSVDILVNNAAVQGPIGPLEENDPKDWLRTLQTNLYGVFLCCRAAIPIMKRQGAGRIINLAGGGSTTPRPNFSAYGASKTAVVRLTETLAAELKPFNIQVNAISPGAINTRMLNEVLAAGAKAGPEAAIEARRQRLTGGTPISKPAALALFLAATDCAGLSGKLISAVWDDWDDIYQNIAKLKNSERYTLRRVS